VESEVDAGPVNSLSQELFFPLSGNTEILTLRKSEGKTRVSDPDPFWIRVYKRDLIIKRYLRNLSKYLFNYFHDKTNNSVQQLL